MVRNTVNNNESLSQDAELLQSIVDASSTMELHRSNLMRLQVEELLEECLLDMKSRKWASEAQDYLQLVTKYVSQVNYKTLIEGEPSCGSNNNVISLKDQADRVVHIPPLSEEKSPLLLMEPLGCTKSQFGWTKKSGNAKQLPAFSFMVQLPTEIFLPKDYLHYRYFDKRNFILNKVAIHLSKQSKQLGKVEYVWAKGTSRSPYLQLIPQFNRSNDKDKKKSPMFQVHIHFGMKSIDWISPLRLVPNRCNLREQRSQDGDESVLASNAKAVKSQLYNQSLLYDARHQFEDPHLSALSEYSNVESTLVLIQIWALKRGLWRNHDGWTMENVAIYLLYLLRTNRMNPRMTPLQQFTVALQMWATTNWLGTGAAATLSNDDSAVHPHVRASVSQGSQFSGQASHQKKCRRTVMVLPLEDTSEKETIRLSELATFYEQQTRDSPLTESDAPTLLDAYTSLEHYSLGPVMLDPSMTYNYLGDVSPNYMKTLQFHAAKSLDGLKATRSAFAYSFMENARFWNQWDMYIQIPLKSSLPKDWETSVRELVSKLEMALGDRINGLRILSTGNGDINGPEQDLDCFPKLSVGTNSTSKQNPKLSPTGHDNVIVGLSVNSEASQRIVDRGPPSDQAFAVKAFMGLWGGKAQLRRFKDGAIVHAVVWNEDDRQEQYQNQAKLQGGYVEKIVRHIVNSHFSKHPISVALSNLLSLVDGVQPKDRQKNALTDPILAHQDALKAFESLSRFLQESSQPIKNSRHQVHLGLPLAIDAVEPLAPCLRYSEIFPPVPHPFLGGPSTGIKKVAGALLSNPILIQIRFGSSSKWPSDLKAIGAAKAAMLVQLANGIESVNDGYFDGPVVVTPSYLDLGYKGFCFRIIVRADPEIKMLEGLASPSAQATSLLGDLTRSHVIASKHHSMIHGVFTLHPSSGAVARMSKRWVANHLLSGLISSEAIELIVAKVYSEDKSPSGVPSTVTSGFIRFLHLLASHDWLGEPLIVNPRKHIDEAEIDDIHVQFEMARGEKRESGPPMYIVAPYDKNNNEKDVMSESSSIQTKQMGWRPSITSPEWVVVSRVVALAKRSYQFLMERLADFDESPEWSAIFHESSTSFHSYNALLRVNQDFIVDHETSSTGTNLNPSAKEDGTIESSYTRSMTARVQGPKALRRKIYKNLQQNTSNDASNSILVSWNPIESLLTSLRNKYGQYALFFCNELAPEVIGLVWRPDVFKAISFSAMTAEYSMPQDADSRSWKNDSLLVRSTSDLLREMSEHFQGIVTTVKILDHTGVSGVKKRKRKTTE
ncbi:Nrap PAP/OAS1-like domain containing protein [Nitzschia inconspicua]|uniref:Nrap PAP/OAS1-like domain containing protein n=1 Tax=Nitzschia inconspicua TaxID=303405 RepID=A0A9K3L1K3_9STRA|nr:Nrap PAP/OAS1-like domain containing protein [Nitzschia inconspicua]